jgi:hypothetical protein
VATWRLCIKHSGNVFKFLAYSYPSIRVYLQVLASLIIKSDRSKRKQVSYRTSSYFFHHSRPHFSHSPPNHPSTHSSIHHPILLLDGFPSHTLLSGVTGLEISPLLHRTNLSCFHTILSSALIPEEPNLSVEFYDLRFFSSPLQLFTSKCERKEGFTVRLSECTRVIVNISTSYRIYKQKGS